MLDLRQYNSLGEALRAALDRWPTRNLPDRSRPRARKSRASHIANSKSKPCPLASALQAAGLQDGTRAAIIMTNQSKWLISAYAIFFCGGVLVPLDYKLTSAEQLTAPRPFSRRISRNRIPSLARNHASRTIQKSRRAHCAGHRSSSRAPNSPARNGGKISAPQPNQHSCLRKRTDPACIVYSSGTGGRPKGCVLTHENYLEQCVALTSLYPFLARRPLPQHPPHESRNRFHGWLHRPVHLRRHRRAPTHPAPRIHPRGIHEIQNHLHGASAHGPEKSRTRPAPKIRRPSRQASEKS